MTKIKVKKSKLTGLFAITRFFCVNFSLNNYLISGPRRNRNFRQTDPQRTTVFIRLNASLDRTPQMEAKLPINAVPNQKNAAFTRG